MKWRKIKLDLDGDVYLKMKAVSDLCGYKLEVVIGVLAAAGMLKQEAMEAQLKTGTAKGRGRKAQGVAPKVSPRRSK